MGCGVAVRRVRLLPGEAVVPDVPTSSVPSEKYALEVFDQELTRLENLLVTEQSSGAFDGLQEPSASGTPEANDNDGGSSSSDSYPGQSPEQQWLRQARRQQRQALRRERAARSKARTSTSSKRSEASGDGGGVRAAATLDDCYTIEASIGRGTFSAVSRCTCVRDRHVRALKTVDKRRCGTERIQEELEIMRLLAQSEHRNIIRLFDTFEDPRYVHIVMELCTGGDLFTRIAGCDLQGFPEAVAARISRQIFSAVRYMHSRHVSHRDLKPENCMLADALPLDQVCLKVIDFGLSKRFQPGQCMHTMACTATYVAPEVLAGSYSEACDIWSVGVIIYVLLSGTPPFSGDTEAQLLKAVSAGFYDFHAQIWKGVSESAKAAIRRALELDVKLRATADQMLQHPWLAESDLGASSPQQSRVASSSKRSSAAGPSVSGSGRKSRVMAGTWVVGMAD